MTSSSSSAVSTPIARLGDFTTDDAGRISLADMCEFYSLDHVTVPETRPYIWSNSVSSLDGITSFLDKGASDSKHIALAHVPDGEAGSAADWRLLNFGWALADAVLLSGGQLRLEPGARYAPQDDDLVEHRSQTRSTDPPLQAVVTYSGNLPPEHPVLGPDLPAVVYTSEQGRSTLLAHLDAHLDSQDLPLHADDDTLDAVLRDTFNLSIVLAQPDDARTDRLSLPWILQHLRGTHNVRFVDVAAGGATIASLLNDRLIDEIRATFSGLVCGLRNTLGSERPRFLQSTAADTLHPGFSAHDAPLYKFAGLRMFGDRHFFIRSVYDASAAPLQSIRTGPRKRTLSASTSSDIKRQRTQE